MEHYFEKKLPGFRITYFHDIYRCLKCKQTMESDIQIGRPLKFLLKKRKISNDIAQSNPPRFFGKHISKPTNKVSDPCDPIKPLKKIFMKKREKDLLFTPIKTLIDEPCKKIMLKKKNSNKVHSEKVEISLLNNKKKNLEKVQKLRKSSKKNSAVLGSEKSNPIKKAARKSVDKGNGTKIPRKGTLKRKRWIHEQFCEENENYEDDVYEMKKFEHFQSLLGDDSDSLDKYDGMKTPDVSYCLSPRATTPSPTFNDCFTPAQLKKFRKGAQEYQYRRQKRMKASNSIIETKSPRVEQPIQETDDIDKLERAVKTFFEMKKKNEKVSGSENECDHYFYDMLDDTNAVERT